MILKIVNLTGIGTTKIVQSIGHLFKSDRTHSSTVRVSERVLMANIPIMYIGCIRVIFKSLKLNYTKLDGHIKL